MVTHPSASIACADDEYVATRKIQCDEMLERLLMLHSHLKFFFPNPRGCDREAQYDRFRCARCE
jgi:hypothetical protein